MAIHYAQAQSFTLYGSGASAGDTSVTLVSFNQPSDGITTTALTMADFGAKGYGTLEPGSTTQEEQISWTGITTNSNGTVTLTGVKTVAFVTPYTETSGLSKSHAGGIRFVVSNTAGFYGTFANKENDEEIVGDWTFDELVTMPTGTSLDIDKGASIEYVNNVAVSGAPNASTAAKGIVQLPTQAQVDARTATGSTGASLTPTPANLRTVLMHDYAASSSGTDAYAITLTPTVTAYTTGDIYIFKADVANTGAASLNVNGLGAKTITGFNGATLKDRDITANSVNIVEYDGTNMQLVSSTGSMFVSNSGRETYGVSNAGTDTYAVTLSPVPLAYTAGMVVRFYADVGNTGGATLNVNGLGAVTLVRPSGAALSTGDITAGNVVTAVHDGTNFQISGLVPSSLTAGQASDASAQHGHAVLQVTNTATIGPTTGSQAFTYAIPAGLLSTKHGIRVRGSFNTQMSRGSGTSQSTTMNIQLDGTNVLSSVSIGGASSGTRDGEFVALIMNNASASAQTTDARLTYTAAATLGTPSTVCQTGTASVNTALSKNLVVTFSTTQGSVDGQDTTIIRNVIFDLVLAP